MIYRAGMKTGISVLNTQIVSFFYLKLMTLRISFIGTPKTRNIWQ